MASTLTVFKTHNKNAVIQGCLQTFYPLKTRNGQFMSSTERYGYKLPDYHTVCTRMFKPQNRHEIFCSFKISHKTKRYINNLL